jgi:hypothetical protein
MLLSWLSSAILPLVVVAPTFAAEPIEVRLTGGPGRYVIDAGDAGFITLSASIRTYVSPRWSVEPGFLLTRGNPYREYWFSCNFIKDVGDWSGQRVMPYGLIGVAYTRSGGSNAALGSVPRYPAIGAGTG